MRLQRFYDILYIVHRQLRSETKEQESEGIHMGVSYKKLFKLLIDRNMKKKDLQEAARLSSASITKLAKDEYVRMEVIVKVCAALKVDIGDIMQVEYDVE